MKFNPDIHYRKSIRLKNYDYSLAGLYFITICVNNRLPLFGEIIDGEMLFRDAGIMIETEWHALSHRFESHLNLHEYVVMPNHFHGIIELVGAIPCGCPDSPLVIALILRIQMRMEQGQGQPAPTIGDIVGAFKSLSTNAYIKNVKRKNWSAFDGKLWQRNYHEHIIRDENSYLKISEYIKTNPLKWREDIYHDKTQ